MTLRRSRAAVLLSLLMLVSLPLASCGGSSPGPSAGPATSRASSQGAATSASGSPSDTATTTAATTTAATTTAATTTAATTTAATTTAANTPAATTTTTKAGRPPEVPAGKAKQGRGPRSTASSDVSIPAAFLISPGGKLSPPSVSVPSGIAIALGVENRDHAPHTIVLAASRRPTLHLRADGGAVVLIPGLPNGSYGILLDGASRGRLVVGAQGGP
jgi:hypothetical protein